MRAAAARAKSLRSRRWRCRLRPSFAAAVHGRAISRLAQDDRDTAARRGRVHEPQAGANADAPDGDRRARRAFLSVAAFSISSRSSTGCRERSLRGGARLKRPSRRSAGRRFSTPIAPRNSRPPPSPARSKKPASPSPWAAAAAGWTIFIERLWRSMKYEDVYLKGYADSHEAARGIAKWVTDARRRFPI